MLCQEHCLLHIYVNHNLSEFFYSQDISMGYPVAQLVEGLCYKLEGRGFDSR